MNICMNAGARQNTVLLRKLSDGVVKKKSFRSSCTLIFISKYIKFLV